MPVLRAVGSRGYLVLVEDKRATRNVVASCDTALDVDTWGSVVVVSRSFSFPFSFAFCLAALILLLERKCFVSEVA